MSKELKINIVLFIISVFILFFLYKVKSILLPFVLGGLVAYLLSDITNNFEKKVGHRGLVAVSLIFLVSVVVVLFFGFAIPILINQITNLLKELSEYITKNSDLINTKIIKITNYFELDTKIDVDSYIASFGKNITSFSLNILNNILSKSIAFISVLSLLIITPITAYYFLMEWNHIIYTVSSYIPKSKQVKFNYLFKEIDNVLSGCFKGQLNVCIILGLFYGTLLMFSGLKYGFIIGLLTGLASFIPYFGMFFGFAIGLIMTVYQFGFNIPHLIATSFIFMFGQFIEGNFVTPKLVGDKIKLHPLWIIFALFSGGSLFGFYGLLLALPIAGVLGVLIRFYIKDLRNG